MSLEIKSPSIFTCEPPPRSIEPGTDESARNYKISIGGA
jgi:hypothetical protein